MRLLVSQLVSAGWSNLTTCWSNPTNSSQLAQALTRTYARARALLLTRSELGLVLPPLDRVQLFLIFSAKDLSFFTLVINSSRRDAACSQFSS